MIAPDDVRARFEAGVCRYMGNGRASLARCEESGIYLVPAVESMWLGYRAAHADLSLYVRELVEAASSSHDYLEAYFKACQSSQPADWLEAALLAKQWHCRIEAALAKYPNQEPRA